MTQNPQPIANRLRSGLPFALGAYFIWGLLPLYLHLLRGIHPFEFVGWRIVFTLPFCLLLVTISQEWQAVRRAITSPRTLAILCASSVLIGINWLLYIWAIQRGHALAASLGYYINPLANVLAGTLFLGEKLGRRQWQSVMLAAIGVALLAFGALDMLYISLSLAVSFSGYGLVRKVAPVESLAGLTIETMLLFIPGILIIAHYTQGTGGQLTNAVAKIDPLLAASGIITAAPLVMFATAARRMDYSALGFVQFLSPTLVFILGIFVFHEPLRPIQLGSFVLIWAAAALFVADLLNRRRANR